MAGQLIKNAPILGRIGESLGKGLSEVVPKEAERYRLSQGLKKIGEQKNLSPFQQFTGLVSAAHEYPQVVQSGSELLKQQGMRDYYGARGQGRNGTPNKGGISSNGNYPSSVQELNEQNQLKEQAGNSDQISPQPQAEQGNGLSENTLPMRPPTPQQYEETLGDIWDSRPGLSFPEAKQLTDQYYQQLAALPAAERERLETQRAERGVIHQEFKNQLEEKLQKKGDAVLQDLTGENLSALKRGMERDLRLHPEKSVPQAAHEWSDKALNLAKAKSQFQGLSSGYGNFTEPSETLKKLEGYQKIYSETGNDEEYWNELQSNWGFSPQGSAYIAYPRSDKVKGYLNDFSKNVKYVSNYKDVEGNSRKYASEIEDVITPKDSILAIAKEMKIRDPYFSEDDFFNQLREDKFGLNERQKREVTQGRATGLMPTAWRDLWYLPKQHQPKVR
jgi:hypothetical protein